MENRKFGNRSIPSLFRIFRFTGQISLLVGIFLLKKKGKGKTRAYALEWKNRKTRLRDGGWGGNPTGARETGAVAVRLVVRFFALFFVFVGFLLYLCDKTKIVVIHKNKNGKLRCET